MPDVPLAFYGGIDLMGLDLSTLLPGEKMNDQVSTVYSNKQGVLKAWFLFQKERWWGPGKYETHTCLLFKLFFGLNFVTHEPIWKWDTEMIDTTMSNINLLPAVFIKSEGHYKMFTLERSETWGHIGILMSLCDTDIQTIHYWSLSLR